AATNSGVLDWSDLPIEKKERAYTLGLAYAAKGDQAKLGEQVEARKALATEESKAGTDSNKRKQDAPPTTYPWDRASPATQSALAELEGYQELAKGNVDEAFRRFAKATSMRPEALARAHLAARNFGFAESFAKKAVENLENQIPPVAAQVEILHATGKDVEAQEAYRRLLDLAKSADRDLPVFKRLAPIVDGWKSEKRRPGESSDPSTDDATVGRIDLTTLGPLTWSPYPAPAFSNLDTTGKPWTLADHKGKNVLVLFVLGGKCAHCMQQLQLFGKELGEFAKLNTEVVALSTDSPEELKALKANPDKIAFPMPLLADPRHEVFKSFRVFDDFENQPLHGTFLLDNQGRVRFQRISADPFLDVDFLKAETQRISRVVMP
ncbi:peroxiredoxin family protein, partial [Singulisphaera rosea]